MPAGMPGLAARLGYSPRQVERHLLAELGAGPPALDRAQRAQTLRRSDAQEGVPEAASSSLAVSSAHSWSAPPTMLSTSRSAGL